MALRKFFFLTALTLAACAGPGHIRYDKETCFIDDQPATLSQVEARQAAVTERILSRQPLLVLITVLVVALAGMSHIEKLVMLFSARRADARGLGDRLRAALDRYRAHPLRYFTMVGVTFALLLIAGGCYIYLDADKRASERALGSLQFCHLALRTAEQKSVLEEQRRNLDSIRSTAGDIRSLVNKLPPEEQQKAKEIIEQMNGALGKQSKLVGEYMARSEDTAQVLREHTQTVERDLNNLEVGIVALKSVPGGIHDLSEAVRDFRSKLDSHDGKLADAGAKLASLETAIKALAGRPERVCPACICDGAGQPRSEARSPADAGAARASK
jgi:DNA repair ATPase RecN